MSRREEKEGGREVGREGGREDVPLAVDHETEGRDTDALAVGVGVQDLLHLGGGFDLRGREGGREGGRDEDGEGPI